MATTAQGRIDRHNNLTGQTVFVAVVPHGKRGTRLIEIAIDDAFLIDLARTLALTDDPSERGHMFYHWERSLPVPCSTCTPDVHAAVKKQDKA